MSQQSIQQKVLEKVFSKCLTRSLSALQTMADTCIALRKKMADVYIALSHWAADEMGIVAVWFCLIKCFQVQASFTWKQGAYVDNQNCPFYEIVKMWTSPLRSSRRDGQKTYMERLIRSPDEGVNCPLPLCGNQNLWPSTRTSEFRIGVLALREH